jgi:hypothetical protein
MPTTLRVLPVAGVIRDCLDSHKQIDLEALRSLIQTALATPNKMTG